MKLSHDLRWLLPYLDRVSDLVPIDKIKQIKVSPYRKYLPSFHGLIETHNYRKYVITVRIYDKPKIPITKLNQEVVLSTLAHELSHLIYFEDYIKDRFLLETKIYSRFGDALLDLGYETDRNRI